MELVNLIFIIIYFLVLLFKYHYKNYYRVYIIYSCYCNNLPNN